MYLLGRNFRGKSVRDTIWLNLQSLKGGGGRGWGVQSSSAGNFINWLCLLAQVAASACSKSFLKFQQSLVYLWTIWLATFSQAAGRKMQIWPITTSNMPESISPWTSDQEINNWEDQKWGLLSTYVAVGAAKRDDHLSDGARLLPTTLNIISLTTYSNYNFFEQGF